MKIRKALAVVLSLAMTVTLMPATAFASSNNFSSVQSVKDDATFQSVFKLELDQPWTAGTVETLSFEITDNGEFTADPATVGVTTTGAAATTTAKSVVVGILSADGAWDDYTIAYKTDANVRVEDTSSDDTSVDLKVTAGATIAKESVLYVWLNMKADGASGDEVKVKMDADGAGIFTSVSERTVAQITGDVTTAEAEDAVTIGRSSNAETAQVTIKELISAGVNKVGDDQAATKQYQTIVLSLPKNITWSDEMTYKAFGGSMIDKTWDANGASDGAPYAVVTGQNTRDLTVTFRVANASSDLTTKQKLTFTPIVNVSKDAKKGSIKLDIEGKKTLMNGDAVATAETANPTEYEALIDDVDGLEIAIYGDANVNIFTKDADDLPEIVSGKEFDPDNDPYVVSVTFEENTTDALTSNKYIDLEFNTDSVQLVAGKAVRMFIGEKYENKDYTKSGTKVAFVDTTGNKDEDTSSFTLYVPSEVEPTADVKSPYYDSTWKANEANTLTLFIPVTVSADYTGDITLTAKGNAGIDETTVTVAKAVAPVTATFSVTNVVNGAQNQATADVTITENFAGALKDNANLVLTLDNLGLGGVVFKNDAKATVTAGDLEIKDSKKGTDNKGNGTLTIAVDDESTTASTIVVSDVAVNLGRTLPEGEYNLKIGGSALVENDTYNKGDFSTNAVKDKYINITTAADTAQTGIVANFYLDGSKNSTYTVNGVDATMDAAAYLDSNNRTMVPIRYVAYALGLVDSDISYNTGDNTATLSGLTNVVKVTTGSNVLQASNGNVTMDTVAVNNGGRLYVPARFIAQAFGAQVAWDQATKTVTITK